MTATSKNTVVRKIERGETVVGAWLLSGSARAAEVLSRTRLDWIGIDTEHAPYSPERVESVVRAIEPRATSLVRLPSVEAAVAGAAERALDAGASGIIVPGVDAPADAERVVRVAKYPPAGERGVAGTVRANAYGEHFDDYVGAANDETLVVIQLESIEAVERAEDILSIDGIDVAFVGENDLSSTINRPGETDHPEVRTAVEQVREAALEQDVIPGIAARTPKSMDQRADRGFQFLLLGADLSFMCRGVKRVLSE